MTLRQAVEYSKQFPRPVGYSYLVRAVRDGKIPAEQVEVPGTKSYYWVIDQAAMDTYLNSPRTPGRKPKGEGSADA